MATSLKRRIEKLECGNGKEETLTVFIKRFGFGLGLDWNCAECEGLQIFKNEGETEEAFMNRAGDFFDNELRKSPTPVRVAHLKCLDQTEVA